MNSMPPPDGSDERDRFDFVIEVLAKDFAEGRTIGALHERQSKHEDVDDQRFGKLERRITKMGEVQAHWIGRAQAAAEQARAQQGSSPSITDTGKFLVPPGLVQTPGVPMVAVNVETTPASHAHHEHKSIMPAGVKKALDGPLGYVIIAVIAGLLGVLGHHFGVTIPQQQNEHVEHTK